MTTAHTATATSPTSTRTDLPAPVRAGVLGGALWMLLPAVWAVTELQEQPYGTPAFFAVAAAYAVVLVLAPALIAVGVVAARRALGATSVGRAGVVLAALGLAAMAIGNGIEVASITAGGGEVAAGHYLFLLGFLAALAGGMVLGVRLLRLRRDTWSVSAGWVLLLALPLGIGIGLLGWLLAPAHDAGFWAAVAVPTGAAWVLLGRSQVLAGGTLTRGRA